MTNRILIECVPNFSEGRDFKIIESITSAIKTTKGVSLLNVDPGQSTNRTVYTFVGHPDAVINAAFNGIKTASELIDMTTHTGEHPRMGACDVCPLIPISGISMDELIPYVHKLAKRVAENLNIPVYLYEHAAQKPDRKNLAVIRKGEYEGLAKKMLTPDWAPDYGNAVHNQRSGATAIGVRDFLVAYNVNLNTTSVRRANSVAFDVRERGRIKRIGHPITGQIVRDLGGEPERIPGACKSVKAIAWFIEEYGIAQISMNLTDLKETPLHEAFEACCESAQKRGMRVTGSELIGLVPKKVLLDAGKYYLHKQRRSTGITEEEIIRISIKSLGLDELQPFDPGNRIIEYLIEDDSHQTFSRDTVQQFMQKVAKESPVPGGGSVSAVVGAMGMALGTMVANLSANKRDWDDRWEEFSNWAERGQDKIDILRKLADDDSNAYRQIIDAIRLPKVTAEEKTKRKSAIQQATCMAIEVPLKIMRECVEGMELLQQMAKEGNPNSVSDAGVGAICAEAAVGGAFLNVKINCVDLQNEDLSQKYLMEANGFMKIAIAKKADILSIVETVLNAS